MNLHCLLESTSYTTGVWVFALCQRHTAKGSKHTAKEFTVGRPRRRPDSDRPDGKHALCRVPFIGHTAKASPCVFDDTRRKKEETARRRRNGRERRGGRLRREPNQTHGKQFQKNKKNQPAAPTAGRTPGAAAGETRGRGAAAGWREMN